MARLSNEHLNTLSTPRLLALWRKIRELKILLTSRIERRTRWSDGETVLCKQWEQEKKSIEEYQKVVKTILDKREHVDRPLTSLESAVFTILKKTPGLNSREITDELHPQQRNWKRKEHAISEALTRLEQLRLINRANQILTGPAKKRRVIVRN